MGQQPTISEIMLHEGANLPIPIHLIQPLLSHQIQILRSSSVLDPMLHSIPADSNRHSNYIKIKYISGKLFTRKYSSPLHFEWLPEHKHLRDDREYP